MSKSDEALDIWLTSNTGRLPMSYGECWDAGRAYQKEQDLAAVEAFKQTRKFSATPYIRCESLCDEIARRIKES